MVNLLEENLLLAERRLEFLLLALALRDVSKDERVDAPLAEVDLADVQLDGEGRAVLATARSLAARADGFVEHHIERRGRIPRVRAQKRTDALARYLFGRVAEHALGRGVERLDAPQLVRSDDAVARRLDHGLELRLPRDGHPAQRPNDDEPEDGGAHDGQQARVGERLDEVGGA